MVEQQQQSFINITEALEALSPWINNPRKMIVQVEVIVLAVAIMLLIQLILGPFRRQSSNTIIQSLVWLTYNLSFPLIAYCLGMMQSSPVKNVMYPIWAAFLLLAAGRTNSTKAYDLDDNRKMLRYVVNFIQYGIYSVIISYLLLPQRLDCKDFLHKIDPSAFDENLKSSIRAGFAVLSLLAFVVPTIPMKLVAHMDTTTLLRVDSKFNKNRPCASHSSEFDPVSMKGYKYPVQYWSYYNLPTALPTSLRSIPTIVSRFKPFIFSRHQIIPIDEIWQCQAPLFSSDRCRGLKDLCLAFSWHELLKQRYYGMDCSRDSIPETHDFFFRGLLRTDDDYERAFRIIEQELGFCHDSFFTTYPSVYRQEILFFILFLLKIVFVFLVGAYVLRNALAILTISAVIEVHPKKTEIITTLFLLGTILITELLEVAYYMTSDWLKVSVSCKYARNSHFHGSVVVENFITTLGRFTIIKYWKGRIGQYSILSVNTAETGESDHVDMLKTVKRAIARFLIECGGYLTNGKFSLMGIDSEERREFCWAWQGNSQAEIMLIWHIATDYCSIAPNNGDQHIDGESKWNKQVAVYISRYCAYLMRSAPELLPGYFGETELAISEVAEELSKTMPLEHVHEHDTYEAMNKLLNEHENYKDLESLGGQEEAKIIFAKGMRLGKQLEDMPDSGRRWKLMADFWAEKILYIAPSDNVKGHMELLSKGGEFLTHIWALLTHAGILQINRENDQPIVPGQSC